MKLALSSAAAPDASLAELASAARRRGLRALELVQGDGHGLLPSAETGWALAATVLGEQQVEVSALRLRDLATAERCGGLAARLGAVVMVPGSEATAFPERLAALAAAGLAPVLAFADPILLLEAAPVLSGGTADFAWDVHPGGYDVAGAAASVLSTLAGRLRHIRLFGGGPEAVAQEGLGVGALMRVLALTGFHGSLALAPSDPRYRVVWNAWLGRRGGWGCGSKAGAHASLPVQKLEIT